jgi:hypothetical protein
VGRTRDAFGARRKQKTHCSYTIRKVRNVRRLLIVALADAFYGSPKRQKHQKHQKGRAAEVSPFHSILIFLTFLMFLGRFEAC